MSTNRRLSRLYPRHRRVEPGTTYLLTKKCNDDLFLLRPSKAVNQILLFVLVVRALRYGILIHGFCFMSNHFHLVVTDVRGELPAFMRDFLSQTSKAIQVSENERRPIWSRKRYSGVQLLDLDAAERKLVYSILNPTRAGLTEPPEWPGLNSGQWKLGDTVTVERPDVYFSKRYQPDAVSMNLECLSKAFDPSGSSSQILDDESRARIQALLESELESLHADLDARGESLAGREWVLECSREQRGSHPVQLRNPRFATKNRGLLRSAIADERDFEVDHAKAKKLYLAGQRRVMFPSGTYGYRVLFGVRVAERRVAA